MQATLTFVWDSYDRPTPEALFGLDGTTVVDGQPTLQWNHKADVAWDWLVQYGYKPVSWVQGKRTGIYGYRRPVTVRFQK